jgi:hypothetical protein
MPAITVISTVQVAPKPKAAKFRYVKPDMSMNAARRGYYALPKVVKEENVILPLTDLRALNVFSSESPVKLDDYGFTAVKHRSVLNSPL